MPLGHAEAQKTQNACSFQARSFSFQRAKVEAGYKTESNCSQTFQQNHAAMRYPCEMQHPTCWPFLQKDGSIDAFLAVSGIPASHPCC